MLFVDFPKRLKKLNLIVTDTIILNKMNFYKSVFIHLINIIIKKRVLSQHLQGTTMFFLKVF